MTSIQDKLEHEETEEIASEPRTRLDEFLRCLPFSAAKLARAADLPAQHLSDLRNGRSSPRADTLARIATAASTLLERDVSVEELWDFRRPPLPPLGKTEKNFYKSDIAPANAGGLSGDPAILRSDLLRLERRFATVDLKALRERNAGAAAKWESEFGGMNDLRSALGLAEIDYSKPSWTRYRAK